MEKNFITERKKGRCLSLFLQKTGLHLELHRHWQQLKGNLQKWRTFQGVFDDSEEVIINSDITSP